jgi:hypothetical protein
VLVMNELKAPKKWGKEKSGKKKKPLVGATH